MECEQEEVGCGTMPSVIQGLFTLLPVFCAPILLVLYRHTSVWPAVLTYHALCWIVILSRRGSLSAAGFTGAQPRQWFQRTLLLSMALVAAGELVRYLILIQVMRPWWQPVLRLMQPWHWYVVYSLLVNPVTEEVYWRGFLLNRMGIARNAWLFWLFHLAVSMVFTEPLRAVWFTVPVLGFGFVTAWMRREYGTIWPCVLIHLAADVAILRGAN